MKLDLAVARNHPASREAFVIFWLGVSSGLPILLVFGTLSIWLREAGIERATIGFLSWAGLSYGFKFVWAPLVDSLQLPGPLGSMGQRRSWMLLSQLGVMVALVWMSLWDPSGGGSSLLLLALGAVALGFSSATQDIAIDAFRIDFASADHQPLLAGTAVAGYRVGMLLAGAGLLEITGLFEEEGSYNPLAWSIGYLSMAGLMLVGVVTTLLVREPDVQRPLVQHQLRDNLRLFAHFLMVVAVFVLLFIALADLPGWIPGSGLFIGFFESSLRLVLAVLGALYSGRLLNRAGLLPQQRFDDVYVAPFHDFFVRYGKWALAFILVICTYRIADIVMGVMAKVFYTDMGYSKEMIGRISFGFGLVVTISGGILGGLLALRWGLMRVFLLGAVLAALSNLVFVWVAGLDQPSNWALLAAIVVDNLSGGLAGAAAVAFLSSLVNRNFSATQYAAFTSITVLLPKLVAGYSGSIVDSIGYGWFFGLTAAMGIPVVLLILWIWGPYRDQVANK